jgi:hypothetical protein
MVGRLKQVILPSLLGENEPHGSIETFRGLPLPDSSAWIAANRRQGEDEKAEHQSSPTAAGNGLWQRIQVPMNAPRPNRSAGRRFGAAA